MGEKLNLVNLPHITELDITEDVFTDNTPYLTNLTGDFEIDVSTTEGMETLHKLLGVDKAPMPDTCDIKMAVIVPARTHRKKRVAKKWLKRYGYRQAFKTIKGWKMEMGTDGKVRFVKDVDE